MRTSVEHEIEEKAPAHAAEAQRRDGALPVAEHDDNPPIGVLASAPPELLHPRMLLGLQAMAGNAAVANLIETRRPPQPAVTLEAPRPPVVEDAAPTPQTTEAAPTEEAAATPRASETDDELAALDAAADQDVSISAAPLGESSVGPGGSDDAPETPGGGGAEPGSPIEDRPASEIPNVSAADPASGLARVGGLPPAQLLSSLGLVSTAVDRQTTEEHERLAANAPQRRRRPGAPATVESPAATRLAPANGSDRTGLPTMPEGREAEVRRPPPPPVAPELPISDGQLPTRDPGLELNPGPLPHLPLEGSADPGLIHQQGSRVLGGLERERASGHQEASRPLGEDEIFPTAPAETLRGSIGEKPGPPGQAAAQQKPAEDDEAASIIAEQEKGAEIQIAVGTGLASLADQRQEYAERTAGERARADAEMSQLEQANVQHQAGERAAAKREVAGLRGEWTTAQQELVAGAQREADAKTSETLETVAKERGAAEEQATTHYEQGQQEAQHARREAEQQAASERQKAQGQSQGGLLGAIGSAAQSLFDKAKQAVKSVFDRARQLVRSAIERAQQLATAVMERARQAIVGAIHLAGTVLTAIGDRVLVAFPALRDRFRKAIQERIAAAEATVNKLANVLKHAVQTALNLLGTALAAAIGLLHSGMEAALDGVRAVVHGALDFARGAVAAFGTFAVLIKDIAASPGQWVSNLAAGVKDGIQKYLWIEVKTAAQGWFHNKVQEVVGVGEAIWHLLQRGGISIAEVAHMAWEGLKAAIAGILIALLIEKLMSLIVPAVGAILTIIQAIQAGWASLGRILQAFEAFFAFLKHAKLGSAGPLFAKAVAAGAIAAVEFVSNFLLTRLKGAASSVSNRLRAFARRIGERLRAIGGRIVRGVKAVGAGFRRAGQKARAGFDRLRGKRPKSHSEQERAKHERQEAAFSATKSHLDALFAKGVTRARLAAEVAWLRLRYRWGSLRVQGSPSARNVAVSGGFSPERTVTAGQVTQEAETLEQMISRYPVAKRKLHQVRTDVFIPGPLKLRWMQQVERALREGRKKGANPNPYVLMVDAVKVHRDNFYHGRPVPLEEIRAAGGLVRHVAVNRIWASLKRDVQDEYRGSVTLWIRKLREDPNRFRVGDLRPGTRVPGTWWSAHYDSSNIGLMAVERLRLERKDYPSGSVRFQLLPEAAALPDLRKPTAFDGMFFRKFAPAPGSVWGIVPIAGANAAGIREGVSKHYVDVSTTTAVYVPMGAREEP